MQRPRVVFFGTPIFAAEILEHLIQQQVDVVAVVSKPDKAVGRSAVLQPTPVKQVAEKYRLPLYQPEKISAPEQIELFQEYRYQADLFVVVAYGEIIKQSLLDVPPKGCINLHASLLPKYRGAAPIQRCLIEGATETGVTVMHMVKQMDAGDIIVKASVPITEEMTYGELSGVLCELSKPLLMDTITQLIQGTAPRIAQDHSQATYAPKIELDECEVKWTSSAFSIHNLIRGTNPEPGAWCFITHKGVKKRLRLFRSKVHSEIQGTSGEIVRWGKQGLIVACGEQSLELLQVQLEGKKIMWSKDLMLGISQEHLSF